MKTTIPAMMLSAAMAFGLAACNTAPTNSDSMGSSQTGTTRSSLNTPGNGENAGRGAAPVNCTLTGTDATSTASMTPGTKCPTEVN